MKFTQIISGFTNRLTGAVDDLPPDLQYQGVYNLLILSLIEDLCGRETGTTVGSILASADITSRAILNPDDQLSGHIFSKQDGLVAGLPIAKAIFKIVEPKIDFIPMADEGTKVFDGQVLAEISGPGHGMLTAERTALNYLGNLSGIATLVNKYIEIIAGTGAQILDTRKTTPGHRKLEKYAVRMGGGTNHRMGLYDMVLIKDNHIDGAGGIKKAINKVRQAYGNTYPIEIEVRNIEELKIALSLDVYRIMLDNMIIQDMAEAVVLSNKRTPLEASGNVNLERVRKIAETGVDFISIGALTHSVNTMDISMRLL